MMSLKYSLYDNVRPAIMSGLALAAVDYFTGKNQDSMQVLQDVGTLIISQVAVKYATDFLPMTDNVGSPGETANKIVLNPLLASMLHEYIYRKTIAVKYRLNSSSLRGTWENYTTVGGCLVVSQLLTDKVMRIFM